MTRLVLYWIIIFYRCKLQMQNVYEFFPQTSALLLILEYSTPQSVKCFLNKSFAFNVWPSSYNQFFALRIISMVNIYVARQVGSQVGRQIGRFYRSVVMLKLVNYIRSRCSNQPLCQPTILKPLGLSVTRFGNFSPLWQNFKTPGNNFQSSLSVWQNFDPTLAIF